MKLGKPVLAVFKKSRIFHVSFPVLLLPRLCATVRPPVGGVFHGRGTDRWTDGRQTVVYLQPAAIKFVRCITGGWHRRVRMRVRVRAHL